MTTQGTRHLRRSFLYVPGSEERKLAKAQTLGADAVILDLEDSVAPERKAEARERISGLLRGTPNRAIEWLIRLNSHERPGKSRPSGTALCWRPPPRRRAPGGRREACAYPYGLW